MDILISIAAKACEYTVAPVGRQLGYLFFYKQNVEDLKTKIHGLKNVKQRIQHEVEEAQNNARGIEGDVNDWLAKADKIITEDHGNFTRHEEQANAKCICGAKVPNLVLRHRLSRRAKKMAETVAAQLQDGNTFKQVSYRLNLPISVGNKGYEEFESRNRTLTDAMEALRDPSVGMVGLWGMGGVGKTMLAKEVARRAKDEEKLFTEVVFTAISKDPNIEKIQQDIGEKLGMRFHEESKDVRADRLRSRLRQENNILIILDDIWDHLDLEDVGISFGGINQKGCKILLTTRSRHVLANDTGVDRNGIFHVGDLLEHEAMSLFRKMVGDQVEEHDDLATQIVKECGGLPIAITTVASALKNRKCADWKNALHELKKSNPGNIPGMEKNVYNGIKFSYDYLESVEAKHLLLLCTLFPEDEEIEIRVMCDYGFGLNLFEDVNTLEEARNKADALVTKLKDHSLLLNADDADDDADGTDRVKLHDVVRDVIFVASKLDDHHRIHNIRNADELEKYFNKEMFKDSTAISLYGIKANQYPQTLKGPELNLLRLVPNYGMDFEKLPHQFFEGLNKLLVLDSERASLKPLPASSSGCLLPNLQTLRLIGCILGDISWIGELKSLKILNLSFNYSIKELPRGIGKLNRLVSLNLEGCRNLEVIEPNVISGFTRLEELNLKNSFTNWEVEGVANASDKGRNANLSEVKELRRLIDLNLEVPDVNSLPKDMFNKKLEKYYIRIGDDQSDYKWGKNTSRTLKLELCPNSVLNEHDFAALLGRSDALYLRRLKIVKSVAFEIDRKGFQRLKHLTVEESTEIRCIVNSNNGNMDCPPAAFPSLESLVLWRLMNLENIIHEKLTTETSFGKLRDIDVYGCDKLKSLFSLFNIARRLQRITVVSCQMMEEIISHDGSEGDHVEKIEISQLRWLRLSGLPKVVQFIATSKSDEIKREGRQCIDAPLFNGQLMFHKLDKLHIFSLNIQKIWNDDQLSSSRFGFQSLTKIKVDYCDHLKGLIPSCMTASLVHLRKLYVSSCKAMKEIVFVEESAQVMGIYVSFPQLEYLKLNNLPNLERFCEGDISFPRLKSLELSDLPDLKRFCEGGISFPRLKSLELSDLKNLKRFCKGDISFPRLKSLELIGLPDLERFCEEDILFPKLESLQLHKLPNLVRFSEGDCVDCPSLSKLAIKDCQKLKVCITNIMPTTTTEKVDKNSTRSTADKQHLSHHKGQVYNLTEDICNIFVTQDARQLVFPKLDKLSISSLNIEKIWNNDQLTSSSFGFQSLTQIDVDHCDHLKGLIPSCMTTSLVHLQNLSVKSCKAMKEIVFIEESSQVMRIYVSFPRLESLVLYDLPDLERFCGGDCVDCPFLSYLAIKGCQKLKVFITNTVPTTTTKKDDKNSTGLVADKQHLSHHKDIGKVDQLSTKSSCLEITCQPSPLGSVEEYDGYFVFKAKRLSEMNVKDDQLSTESSCSMEEHDEYLVFKTNRLSELTLWNFPNQQQLPKTFPTVEVLSICEWGIKLKDLAMPLMSFQNLNVLLVNNCHGLTSLLSPSTAKSLSQRLTKLGISGCKSLRQVIANDDDDNINIIFSRLKCLVLDDLSNLTSFYSGHNRVILEFPRLAQLIVGCCPEMKIFSLGNIYCPSLHCISHGKYRVSYWKGDINTTIQKLWEDNNMKLKKLKQKQKKQKLKKLKALRLATEDNNIKALRFIRN